jgi:preprotein translocase subunit SecF
LVLKVLMLFVNAFVIKSRGHYLNWGVDFSGGTELKLQPSCRRRR